MPKQINIFVENRAGRIMSITEALYKENINIRAMAVQDRGEFGLVKVIVNKPDQAVRVLQQAGFACKEKDVLAVVLEDRPGGLFHLLKVFPEGNVNILDAYGFAAETIKGAVFLLEVENPAEAEAFLKARGFTLLSAHDVMQI